MGLETNYNAIGDLNEAWPTGSEFKSFGDNHLRGIKEAVRKTFPGSTGAVVATGVDGGVVNTYTLTSATPLPAYTARTLYVFTPPITNTGPATLNVSSLGPRAIKTVSGAPLMGGDLPAGIPVLAIDTGAEVRLIAITKRYADNLAASGAFPDQTDNAGKVTRTDGASVFWEEVGTKGADVASAATLDLSSAVGDFRHVTGTTTVTAITLPVGAERTLVFDGVLTLTHGAGLLLPGMLNVVTAANDRMIVRGDTAGAIVVSYTRASGRSISNQAAGIQVLAVSGPFVVPAADFEVELIGGGQAGGRNSSGGDGGIAGSTVIKRFSGAVIGSTAMFVAGAAGVGLVSDQGVAGGNSSFTLAGFSALLAGGGATITDGNGIKFPGPASGGDINILGQRGGRPVATGGADYLGGTGGSTRYGFGGVASPSSSAQATATGFGAGGGAGASYTNVPSGGNGSGTQGVAIIRF